MQKREPINNINIIIMYGIGMEERKRKCRQRRSALSSPKSVDEVISKWIEEKGSGWNAQLRTDLEGRLLTHGISLTIDVVQGMVKQRLSEISK